MEFFIHNKELISEDKYKEIVNSLKPKEELDEPESKIVIRLKKLVDDSIKKRIENTDEVGIFFSGGLDSSYIAAICKKLKMNFTCYTVGFQDGQFKVPEDIIHSKNVAKFLKLKEDEFKSKIFDLKEVEIIISKTTKILNSSKFNKISATKLNNVVNVGVGAVVVAGHSISKKEKIFFSGLGSEELFAGYDRHKKNPTNEECFSGLLNMYQRDLLRDASISNALGFEFRTPFLDEELIKYALAIPIKFKVNDSESKIIMRKAAVDLLAKFSERPKKAAQYGSCFDRAIAKLAKKKGFEFKKDYLESIK